MESLTKLDNLSQDTKEAVSLLCYISQVSQTCLNQNEFETATKICYLSLTTIFPQDDYLNIISIFLKTIEDTGNIQLDKCTKLFIRNNNCCNLILLCSLKHYSEIFHGSRKSNISKIKIQEILPHFYRLLLPNKLESIHGLRLLESLLKKRKDILDKNTTLDILKFVNFTGITQIEGFKHHGQNIAKIILTTTTDLQEFKKIFSYSTIPIPGIQTQGLTQILAINSDDKIVIWVEKILHMFSNNIENRDAGFLYKELMFKDFDKWKEKVWPCFAKKLEKINPEGEFFESLLKYWVPTGVAAFRSEFYKFLVNQQIDNILKAHILLETRKKGFYEENFNTNLGEWFYEKNTSNIALKILCTFPKRTICPSLAETELLTNYLYSFDDSCLDNDQLKSLARFFSQIFLTAHEHLIKNEDYEFYDYKQFLTTVFDYCVKCLESNRKEVGSQILSVIWKIASGSPDFLSLGYKLENGKGYDTLDNKFFQQSIGNFGEYSKELSEVVKKIFKKDYITLGKNFSKLISQRCYDIEINIENSLLFQIIDESTNIASIEHVDNIKNYTCILMATNNYKKNNDFLKELLIKVQKDIDKTVDSNSDALFKIVLYLEVLYAVPEDFRLIQTLFVCEVIEKCLYVIESLLDRDKMDEVENFKAQKVLEAFINITLALLIHENTSFYEFLDKHTILHQMQKIITTSNMKKPTTLAANVIKIVSKSMSHNEQEKNQRLQFLVKALSGLHEVPTCQNLTIRKCPETRLVLHALCVADPHEKKPLLHWTLDYILDILSHPNSTDSEVSSAFYCAEPLIADNSLYNHTFGYVPQFIICGVQLFKRPNWVVRNAILQLIKVIIDRFLGVLIGPCSRKRSIEDMFLLFPELAVEFYKFVSVDGPTDSSIIIFQFFIESQFKKRAFKHKFLEIIRQSFFQAFWKIINENTGHFGTFAVRALVSMCIEENIPFIFREILKSLNVKQIRATHTLKNFVLLLREFYSKYQTYSDNFSRAKINLKVMEQNYDKYFISCLNQSPQLDLLLVKVIPRIFILNNMTSRNLNGDSFENRIWQHNYLPSLIKNSPVENLPFLLNKLLVDENNKLSDFVQVKILSVLVEKVNHDLLISDSTLVVLFEKIVSIDDSKNYLLFCYLKLILLLVENKLNFNVSTNKLDYIVKIMRNKYEKLENVYKIISLVIILSQISEKTDKDKRMINSSIKLLRFYNSEDEREVISQSLIYFYQNSSCDCGKNEILKLALMTLLNYGLYDFVSMFKKIKINSTITALVKLFEIAQCLEENYFYSFVHYAYSFGGNDRKVKGTINSLRGCKTYFSEQNLVYIDQPVINRVILYFLRKKLTIQT